MNIFESINAVMKDCGFIAKDSKNQQQNYKFRGIDAVMNALNPALIKNKVFVVPEVLEQEREERQTSKGGLLIYSVVKVRYKFYAEDGSCVEACVVGEGMDSGDKATNKAMSAAFKYACFQTFCIPTEEMKDSEDDSPEPAPKQRKTAQKPAQKAPQKEEPSPHENDLISKTKVTALKAKLQNDGVPEDTILFLYKVKSLEEMTEKMYSNMVEHWKEILAYGK